MIWTDREINDHLCDRGLVDQYNSYLILLYLNVADVLILNQFIQENGKIIPREFTGLCHRQHHRMNKLIRMAQKAGLFPNKDVYHKEKLEKPWAKFNTYWDEKTIDIQHHEILKKSRLKSYKK